MKLTRIIIKAPNFRYFYKIILKSSASGTRAIGSGPHHDQVFHVQNSEYLLKKLGLGHILDFISLFFLHRLSTNALTSLINMGPRLTDFGIFHPPCLLIP